MTNKPTEIPIGYLVYQAQRAIQQAINQAFCEARIPFAIEQWAVMMEIYNSNGSSQQFIANKTRKDKATLTRLIRTLEKNGLVECRMDSKDKRKKLIFYTEKAGNVRNRCTEVLDKMNLEIMKNIEEENELIFRNTMKTIFSNLNWNFEFMNIKNRT